MAKKSAVLNLVERTDADPVLPLLVEYERLTTNAQQCMSRIFLIISLGAATLGVVATQIPSMNDPNVDRNVLRVVYVAFPLAFTVLIALLVEQIWIMVFEGYHLRAVEQRIGEMTNKTDLFRFAEAGGRAFYSVRSGPIKHMFSYVVMFLAGAAAYLGVTVFCLRAMISLDVPWPLVVTAVLSYAIAIALVLAAFEGALIDSRSIYEQAMGERDVRDKDALVIFRRLVSYLVLPRPNDLIVKTPFFWIGVIAAVVTAQLAKSFSTNEFKSHIGTIVFAFVVVELFVNQAKYMWNDVRGRQSDSNIPWKKHRLPAAYPTEAMAHVVSSACLVRAAAGLAAAAVAGAYFGLWALLPFALSLVGVQAVYEFGGGRGLRRLAVASVGYVLRTLAGLAVTVSLLGLDLLDAVTMGVFVTMWIAAFSVEFLGAWWRAESEHSREEGFNPERVRPGLGAIERSRFLHLAAATASIVLASGIVVPFRVIDGTWNASWAVAAGPLPIALAGVALLKLLPRCLVMFALPLFGVAAGITAAVFSMLDTGPAGLLWTASFPAAATCLALFFLNARYEELAIQIPVRPIIAWFLRAYRFVFAIAPPSRATA